MKEWKRKFFYNFINLIPRVSQLLVPSGVGKSCNLTGKGWQVTVFLLMTCVLNPSYIWKRELTFLWRDKWGEPKEKPSRGRNAFQHGLLFHRVANGILMRWFQLDFTDVSSVKSLFKWNLSKGFFVTSLGYTEKECALTYETIDKWIPHDSALLQNLMSLYM